MTTSLQIKNNVSTYTDISNIFKIDTGATGADANKYQNSNSDIKFVPIIDTNALYTPLKNAQTGFQINGTDISTKYMCNYTKIYTGMTNPETITIGTNTLYNKIVFLLQGAGGNRASNVTGTKFSGGSGACYIGYVDLTYIIITSIEIYVSNTIASYIIFNTSGAYKINCARGGGGSSSSQTAAAVTITFNGGAADLPTNFTQFQRLTGLKGGKDDTDGTDSNQNGYTLNPYIQNGDTDPQKPNKISYGNMFQPINSSYDLHGAGGSSSNNNIYSAGKPGLGCIWFVK